MQIVKRHSMFYNVIFYSLLSLLTIHVSLALLTEASAFNLSLFYELFESFSLIALLFALFVISAIFHLRLSLYLYYLASLCAVCFLLFSLYGNFNKAVLFVIFAYSILAYFLGQGWKQTLYFACYNSNLSDKGIDDAISLKMRVRIEIEKGKVYEGFLTNWDEMGCFIRWKDKNVEKLKGSVRAITEYNGKEFTNRGKIVSCVENKGIGIIFDINREKKFNWQDFYNIMEEMSFTPEYLVQ